MQNHAKDILHGNTCVRLSALANFWLGMVYDDTWFSLSGTLVGV